MLRGMKAILLTLIATAFAATAQAGGDGKTFASPGDEDAAVVRTDVELLASGIFPVHVVSINNEDITSHTKNALFLEAGTHTLSVEGREKSDFSAKATANSPVTMDEVDYKVKLEAGKIYYLGAKINENMVWEPVIWRIEEADFLAKE